MKVTNKLCTIVFLCMTFVAVSSCKKNIDDSLVKKEELVIIPGLRDLPDPTVSEVKSLVGESTLKSTKLKSSSTESNTSIEIERLDSAYFISKSTRRYLIKITDGYETVLKYGYMLQSFVSSNRYEISFSWGFSKGDSISREVTPVYNVNFEGDVVLVLTTIQKSKERMTFKRTIKKGETLILPPVRFAISAKLGDSYGSANTLGAAETSLYLGIELFSNIKAIICLPISPEHRLYGGEYWVCVRGSNNLHVDRTYASAAGDTAIYVSVPFGPITVVMTRKFINGSQVESDSKTYYSDPLIFLGKEGGKNMYTAKLAVMSSL